MARCRAFALLIAALATQLNTCAGLQDLQAHNESLTGTSYAASPPAGSSSKQTASEEGLRETAPLRNPGNLAGDCHTPCGGPGLCNAFCGQGNACCRRGGDIDVPNECKDIHTYWTWGYECVKPVRPAMTDDGPELGAGPTQAFMSTGPEAAPSQAGAGDGVLAWTLCGVGSVLVVGLIAQYRLARESISAASDDSDSDWYEPSCSEVPSARAVAAGVGQPMPAGLHKGLIAAPTLLQSAAPNK
eukprot:TRINITY_DN62522_c0_g1_i1.p1 TRINITY_DN62522_c0_g1~~TRINITY_DN62522_c0_g1_i1.p1  ORF type:complete len:264 (-),score=44.80 TRINITY_DN62522_c0_g1_i1:35-766(-)